MSVYGEEILKRINSNSELANPNNPAHIVIDNTIGEWLDNFSLTDLYEGIFLNSALKGYLDLFGNDFNIIRQKDEDDESYRKRIIYESLGHLTVDYLIGVYNLILYVYVANYNAENNQLTSDNTYISKYGFMTVASDEIKDILTRKFVIGGELSWLIP